ncbi:GTP pyrophosphokinase [Simplicispira suum]|uniref:(P)ppGpp synthetase n=1 Tax=Simplicispira suum TaxID=2109915 RepID=A0A2S0N591_9BURK|nr:(p)ppGpp synthetase [Simplicispira suum]AVO43319.1 (p)ppGpp synthetase [Simplicispira suum]MBW7833513.1 (p)ppGpp synthetase [Simplicispira suum]
MPTLDFERERARFLDFHAEHEPQWRTEAAAYTGQLQRILSSTVPGCKLEWRVKDAKEALRKFSRKYRASLEESGAPYEIRHYVTDLIGLRVVCLYEDELEKVASIVRQHFDVIEMTDKVSAVEGTESSFGYKGLHLDLRPAAPDGAETSTGTAFELQIRTVIQDSWSVLDHKIKYKKAIPGPLARRINVLAALFELADREFRQIRDETELEIRQAPDESEVELDAFETAPRTGRDVASNQLNAFTFLKIATHFFKEFEFEPHKVEGFVVDIHVWAPDITRARFNHLIRHHIGTVKRYRQFLEDQQPGGSFNPYTVMRHCLYLGDRVVFAPALRKVARTSFDAWLQTNAPREKS